MKKILLVISIALSGIITSCQVELLTPQSNTVQQQEIPDGVIAPEITAHLENGTPSNTKTILEVDGEGVGTIYWKPADEINIFYGTSSTHYTSQNDVNATTAVFTTSDVIGSTESASENIWGLYPYNSSATCTGSAVITTLPATQYGVPGTFDDDLFITLAHNTSTVLKFYNVCGGIKFSLSRDDITSITFRGNNNEDIAGTISLNFVNDVPNVGIISGEKTITITPKTGSTFTSGDYYYIILCPISLSNGFTMTFTTLLGQEGFFNYSSSAVSIKRSVFGKKDAIDSYAVFSTPSNQIWYTSTDGAVVSPSASAFAENIVSNIYSDGIGIITFDNALSSIGTTAFYNCSTLQRIVIPCEVTSIGNGAFNKCTSLESVVIPNSITTIGDGAFEHCESLPRIYIPDSVTSLGDAFYYCRALQSITLSKNISSISALTFYYCDNLLEISIPNGVTSIGEQAFYSCKLLQKVELPNSLISIGERAFDTCRALHSITLPNSITSIGASAFSGCRSVESLIIPSNVTEINNYTFSYCRALKTITIPSDVSHIDYYAFYYCDSLDSIFVLADTPPVGGNKMFTSTNECPIYVPAGSVDDYKLAEYWSDYASRIQAMP